MAKVAVPPREVKPGDVIWFAVPFSVMELFASPALVSVPEIVAATLLPEGLEKLIVIPVTAEPFWKFVGEPKAAPPLTVMTEPLPPEPQVVPVPLMIPVVLAWRH
jgi:hypothetical protein